MLLLWWGPEFVQIYNDAYLSVLGDKHPRAMGQRLAECWTEVFDIVGPMAERPFLGGPASVSDDLTHGAFHYSGRTLFLRAPDNPNPLTYHSLAQVYASLKRLAAESLLAAAPAPVREARASELDMTESLL